MGPVMGPEAHDELRCEFSPTIPPRLRDCDNYASYRENIYAWRLLSTLPSSKHGPAIIGRLHGDAKLVAKSATIDIICSQLGADIILESLDRLFRFKKEPIPVHSHPTARHSDETSLYGTSFQSTRSDATAASEHQSSEKKSSVTHLSYSCLLYTSDAADE